MSWEEFAFGFCAALVIVALCFFSSCVERANVAWECQTVGAFVENGATYDCTRREQ